MAKNNGKQTMTDETTNANVPEVELVQPKGAPVNGAGAKTRDWDDVSNDLPTVWDLDKAEVGDYLEGYYVGAKEIRKRQAKFNIHIIQNEATGELMSVSGSIVDRLLAPVPHNAYIQVVYTGRIDTDNGLAKNFRLRVQKGTKLLDPGAPKLAAV